MAANSDIKNQEVVSGDVGRHEVVIDAQQLPARPDQIKKPWSSLPTFLTYLRDRYQGIGLHLSPGKRRRPRRPFRQRRTVESKETAPSPLLSPQTTGIPIIQSLEPKIRSTDANNEEEHVVNTEAEIVGKLIPVHGQNVSKNIEMARSRPSSAFMAEILPQTSTGVACKHSPTKPSQLFKIISLKHSADGNTSMKDSLETNFESARSKFGSEMSGSRTYSEMDHQVKGYVPRKAREDDSEFVASAVMMKDGSGAIRAVKLFYDPMSADNWASENFARFYDLRPRPIRPEELKVYTTVGGEFIPTHCAEIELQDDSRGMKDFVKLTVNLIPWMDGAGLIAGRSFLKEHRIVIDVTASRDIF